MQKITMVIHGGAGTISKEDMTGELEQKYLDGLHQALDAGYAVLQQGGHAIDAVKAAVVCLEDSLLFNAGKGSVFTKKGTHEMDAAIMDGTDLSAGAVAGIRNIKNPIVLATEVMRNSDHVFLCGEGAHEFALKQGVKTEDDEYFFSKFRYDQWQATKDSDEYSLDHSKQDDKANRNKKFGTVGAVACDINGNVAAATSTGGMTNKQFGRIGDTPIIGAGTYANNKTAAISCTGHGELFIRAVAAYDVHALMAYKGLNVQQASEDVVMDKLVKIKGEGGLIAVDANGDAAMVFNSDGMYRGVRSSDGTNRVEIFK